MTFRKLQERKMSRIRYQTGVGEVDVRQELVNVGPGNKANIFQPLICWKNHNGIYMKSPEIIS